MKVIFLSFLGLLISLTALAGERPKVIAAYATSSSPDSTGVICLLDKNCQGLWKHGGRDKGVDEGIYIQFEEPVTIHYISIEGEFYEYDFQAYINGNTGGGGGQYTTDAYRPWNVSQKLYPGNAVVSRRQNPIQEKIKSVFLKIRGDQQPASIKRITFFDKNPMEVNSVPMDVEFPKLISSKVVASSTLAPQTAYRAENLVDSRYDSAWSTDGKTTDGKGESFTIELSEPVNLAGIIVWNGYQRSESHFNANSRVAKALISTDISPTAETITLKDSMGRQDVRFSKVMAGVRKLKFQVAETIKGNAYRDLLVSEIRLIDDKGKIIIPIASPPRVAAPSLWNNIVGKSYATILHKPVKPTVVKDGYLEISNGCDNATIRLRDNGTFVIYKKFDYAKGNDDVVMSTGVAPKNVEAVALEGNWEGVGENLRIFGRQYKTVLATNEYAPLGKAKDEPRTTIFQSELKIRSYSKLSKIEKNKLFDFLWQKKGGPKEKQQKMTWYIATNPITAIEGNNTTELYDKLDAVLGTINPVWIESSVLSDLIIPTDGVTQCYSGFSG